MVWEYDFIDVICTGYRSGSVDNTPLKSTDLLTQIDYPFSNIEYLYFFSVGEILVMVNLYYLDKVLRIIIDENAVFTLDLSAYIEDSYKHLVRKVGGIIL